MINRKVKMFLIVVGIMITVSILLNMCSKDKYTPSDANFLNHFYVAQNTQGEKVYLLGTMHLTNKPVKEIPNEIEKYFNESNNVFIESKIDMEESKKFQYKLYENAVRDISDKEVQKYWDNIQKEYSSINDLYNKLNAMAINSIATQEVINELGLKEIETMDELIYKKSLDHHKTIIEFEGILNQYNTISELSKKCSAYILNSVKNKEIFLEATKQSWENYCSDKEIKAVDKTNNLSKKLSKEEEMFSNILVENRNNNMIKKLFENKEKIKFVSVGVGHIYGENGLKKQLEKRGFTVSKVV